MELTTIVKNAVRVNHALVPSDERKELKELEFYSDPKLDGSILMAMAVWYDLILTYNLGEPIQVMGLSGAERDFIKDKWKVLKSNARFNIKCLLCCNYIDQKLQKSKKLPSIAIVNV